MFIRDLIAIILISVINIIDQHLVCVVIYYDYFSPLLEEVQREKLELMHQQLTVV